MPSTVQRQDLVCKLVIIGDTEVGKTCLMGRFTDDEFLHTLVSTIGIDIKLKNMEVLGKQVKVQVWDTCGLERYYSLTTVHYRDVKGIIIAYDITNRKSFESIIKWVKNDLQRWATYDDVEKMLIGNKSDLEEDRKVGLKEGRKIAEQYQMCFNETSAKYGSNVEKAFMELIHKIVEKELLKSEQEEENNSVTINHERTDSSSRISQCCK